MKKFQTIGVVGEGAYGVVLKSINRGSREVGIISQSIIYFISGHKEV
jgi:hypothetical protein